MKISVNETTVGIQGRGIPAPEQNAPARWTLASLALSILLASLGTSIANVALPTLGKAFAASFQEVQWIVLAYLLAVTSLIVTVGRLGDMIERRKLLLTGIALFMGASVLCGAAPTLRVLIAARAAQGLGAAIMMTLAMALVSETVPKARTGSAMGLLGTMSAIGTALGPSLGGVLIAGLGWRAIFLVNVPLGAGALVLTYRSVPVGRTVARGARPRLDLIGTVLLALTLAAYALAMTAGRGHPGPLNLLLLLAAAVGMGLLVAAERRAAMPLIRLETLRNPLLRTSLAASALVSTVMMATLVVGPFYLSRVLNLDPALVGMVMSAGPIMAALTGLPAGRLVDRFGAWRMTILGLSGIATGSLMLSLLPTSLGIIGYLVPIIIMTASYAQFQAANNTAAMVKAGPDQKGVVSGMLNLSRNLGLITGASCMGMVFAIGAGTSDLASGSAEAVAAGMRMTFGIGALLIGTCLVLAARALGAATSRSEWRWSALLLREEKSAVEFGKGEARD